MDKKKGEIRTCNQEGCEEQFFVPWFKCKKFKTSYCKNHTTKKGKTENWFTCSIEGCEEQVYRTPKKRPKRDEVRCENHSHSHNKGGPYKKPVHTFTCHLEGCNNTFTRTQDRVKSNKTKEFFCTKECYYKHPGKFPSGNPRKNGKKFECGNEGCGNTFYRPGHRVKGNRNLHYCSISCYHQHKRTPDYDNILRTKPELKFESLLRDWKVYYRIEHRVHWKSDRYKFYDFYLPDYNLLVEVDGEYHHGKGKKVSEMNELQWDCNRNDRLKNLLSRERGYELVRVWGDEIDSLTSFEDLLNKRKVWYSSK